MRETGDTDPADGDLAASGAADRAFLGLERTGDDRGSFPLTGALARHDGRLYGGTAVAAAVAMAEQASQRRCLWTTVQFVSGSSTVGDRIDCQVEVLAAGRRTTQLRVIGRVGSQEIFCALAATAVPKARALQGVYEEPPTVLEPELCEEFRFPVPEAMRATDVGLERHLEIRIAADVEGRPIRPGHLCFWTRVRDHRATPALIGYMADMVPMSVVHAAGHVGGGTSLDNTIRIGPPADTDWVLLQLDPHQAVGGYGHGTVHVWSPDGVLVASASQTASLLVLD